MDYMMLSFIMWITVICPLPGANADCAADLAKTDAYTTCFGQFGMWATEAFGGGGDPNGGSGSDTPPDVMALLCTPEAKGKIGCFFKYMIQCPQILSSMGGGEAAGAFSIPGVNMTSLTGTDPLETMCNSMPGGACSTWMSCMTETDPSQLTPALGVPAQTYNMVPDHYKTFLSMVYMVCGNLKPQMDCAMTKLEENSCPMDVFEAMAKNIVNQHLKTMTYEENKLFMKDECPAVTDAFRTCVGTTLAKPEFKECYTNATDMYTTAKTRNSCGMYSANKECLNLVQTDCGKPAAMWLIKHSPKIVDSGLPTDCEVTTESTMITTPTSTIITTSTNKMLGTSESKIDGTSGSMILNVSRGITLMVVMVSFF